LVPTRPPPHVGGYVEVLKLAPDGCLSVLANSPTIANFSPNHIKNRMRFIKPTLLAVTGLACAMVSNASVDSAVESRSLRAQLDAADAAQQETIVLAVSGMT
jgi:hypothetical protein